jgi:transcription antitermination factor NusG
MKVENKWYVVYTRPRWEKKVAAQLSRHGIENYCPLNKVLRQWSDRKKIIEEPLFTSYVFVRIEENAQLDVRMVDGILNFVYWLGKPAIIRDAEIDLIKKFLSDHENVQVQPVEVNLSDRVRIISGPFMMREGNVLEIKRKTVKVLLPSLGCSLIAEIKKGNIEKTVID